jgi:spore coat polysaccharide biosynthesis protein SpsF
MKTVVIIQARTGSTRLPGKVLIEVEGQSILGHTVQRARAIEGVDEVVVATTREPSDDAVVAEAQRLGAPWVRGSEHDVLSRYLDAARAHEADVVLRITSDCPLLDPAVSSRIVRGFRTAGAELDYAATRDYPRGLDTEVLTRETLERTGELARAPREREHVTLYIYEHPETFRLRFFHAEVNHASHRWTLDTDDDLRLVRAVYERLAPTHGVMFGMPEVLALLEREPWIAELNAHVVQKKA